jgi:hypothetical protein
MADDTKLSDSTIGSKDRCGPDIITGTTIQKDGSLVVTYSNESVKVPFEHTFAYGISDEQG